MALDFNKSGQKSFAERITDLESDPTKSSVVGVEHQGALQFYKLHKRTDNPYIASNRRELKDAHGRSFFEINEHGADQMFLARILKGIMPVCDVVYNNGRFFSYAMLPELAHGNPERIPWRERLIVYDFLLYVVFDDADHYSSVNNVKVSGNEI